MTAYVTVHSMTVHTVGNVRVVWVLGLDVAKINDPNICQFSYEFT